MSRGFPRRRAGEHVEQHHGGDAGDHGRKDEDDGHQRRRPPRVRFDGSEDEADISMEKEGGGDTDERDDVADAIVDAEGALADVVGAKA